MLADWQISKAYFSKLLKSWYPKVFERIENTLIAHNIPIELLSHTKDIWARDYMPIALSNGSFVQYNYHPDYLSEERKYQSDPALVSSNLELLITKCPLIIDGGNVVKSEKAVIMTDKVFSENSGQLSKQEVIDLLKTHFGISKIYFIPWDKDAEKYGHSDGMLRFY